MQTGHLPRVRLAALPTPLEPARRLGEALDGVDLWLKRDDYTGVGLGGNKARKLEFLAAQALEQGADVLLTVGGQQSNHCRVTAAVAARLGLEAVLVLYGERPAAVTGNLLLDGILGAKVVFSGHDDAEGAVAVLEETAERLRSAGRRPYVIPLGGSSPLGTVGYALAVYEFISQANDLGLSFDRFIFATGSGGTQAGLMLGALASGSGIKVTGVTVSRAPERLRPTIASLVRAGAALAGCPMTLAEADVDVLDGYVGEKYGAVTEASLEAIRLTARTEGALLDPVYTGKAMAGLIGLARSGRLAGERVAFWHTGGVAALPAYADAFRGGA
ncbi:MAG: D-cysteine desulfhydrase family protein [Bacillota bacterium]